MAEESNELEQLLETTEQTPGFLYVLHAEGTAFVKIGYTCGSVEQRRNELQPGCPQRLKILYILPCDDPPAVERIMHERFDAYKLHGEWFALPQDIPTVLDLLGFIYTYQSTSSAPASNGFDPKRYAAENARILQLFQSQESLTIPEITEALGLARETDRSRIRVALFRMHRAGLLGKSARGVYYTMGLPDTTEVAP